MTENHDMHIILTVDRGQQAASAARLARHSQQRSQNSQGSRARARAYLRSRAVC